MDDTSRQIGELREEMQVGFKDLRSEIKDVRSEVKDVRAEIGVEHSEARAEFRLMHETMETRFDAVHRWMIGTMGTMLVVVASILASARL